jgi:hypothetical protein
MLIISNTFIAKAHLKYDELGEMKNIHLFFLKETLGNNNRITTWIYGILRLWYSELNNRSLCLLVWKLLLVMSILFHIHTQRQLFKRYMMPKLYSKKL